MVTATRAALPKCSPCAFSLLRPAIFQLTYTGRRKPLPRMSIKSKKTPGSDAALAPPSLTSAKEFAFLYCMMPDAADLSFLCPTLLLPYS